MSHPSSFRQELEAAVNARHSRLNPFTERWVKGELTRAQLGAWAAQHYQYVGQFPRWCARVYADCPYSDARDFLLENIIEEESGTKHVDLLIRFAEACGVSRTEVETTRQLPTTRALTAWCYEMSHQPFYEAAAGLLVGLESQVPGHLPAQPAASQAALRLLRPRGGVLCRPHRGRRGARRAGLRDRRAGVHHTRDAGARRGRRAPGHRDALAVHDGAVPRLRPQGGAMSGAVRVARLDELASGQTKLVEVHGHRVVLVRVGDASTPAVTCAPTRAGRSVTAGCTDRAWPAPGTAGTSTSAPASACCQGEGPCPQLPRPGRGGRGVGRGLT